MLSLTDGPHVTDDQQGSHQKASEAIPDDENEQPLIGESIFSLLHRQANERIHTDQAHCLIETSLTLWFIPKCRNREKYSLQLEKRCFARDLFIWLDSHCYNRCSCFFARDAAFRFTDFAVSRWGVVLTSVRRLFSQARSKVRAKDCSTLVSRLRRKNNSNICVRVNHSKKLSVVRDFDWTKSSS